MKLWCIYHARRHTDSHFNNGVFCSVSVAMSAMHFPKAVDVIETLEVVIKNSFLDFIFFNLFGLKIFLSPMPLTVSSLLVECIK